MVYHFREDCLAVKDLFCFDEWLTVEENKKQRVFFKSRAHFRLPRCGELPSRDNESAPCSRVELFDFQASKLTSK